MRCAQPTNHVKRVSIVTTVLNDEAGVRVLLDSIPEQTRTPDEVIVVDGGSTDGTVAVIREASHSNPRVRLIEAPGANIGRGRNIGIEQATGEVIASTDTGCRLDPHWLERMVAPFEDGRRADFVAGFYRIAPHTFLECVIGTTTMRGALDPVNPETFNPSGRSVAYTKSLWRRAGGVPDFLAIDDTLFDAKIRSMNVRWVFVGDAIAHWRPRGSFRSLFRQFKFYGTSAGHTQMFAEGTWYNLRNLALIGGLCLGGLWQQALWILALAAVGYFHVYGYHVKSWRVMKRLGDWRAYPAALGVHWVMMVGDAVGYLLGTVQRWGDPRRYRGGLIHYMSAGASGGDGEAPDRGVKGAAS